MPYTLAQAQEKLEYWTSLQEKAAATQSYSYDTAGFRRQHARADLDQISRQVEKWEKLVARLERGGMRVRRAVPV